ncbi:MAG: hypothetical protein IDH49_09205 [Gammaproteobacteria bacterium]|nr:hypothetical protein [Gammaproteobacteria bacterium]
MRLSALWRGVLLSAAMAGLISCGGGAGPGLAGGGIGGTGISQGPVTGFGSIFVNGLEIETTGAKIEVEDNPSASQNDLHVGMVVLVEWEKDASGKYTAKRVKYADDVQGPVDSITPPATGGTFIVLGQTVRVDGLTVFSGTSGIAGTNPLKQSDIVEVSGLKDTTGVIHATRVEVKTGSSEPSEIKGRVTAYTPGTNTFNIGEVTVSFSSSVPAGLGNGVCVEVKGTFDSATSIITATSIELDDSCGLGGVAEGKEVEVEGFISDLAAAAGTFKVNGQPVRYDTATRYENGDAGNLRNNVRVEAEGTVSNGVLVAKKISFKLGGDDDSAGGGTGGGGIAVSEVTGAVIGKAANRVTVSDDAQPSAQIPVTVNNDTLFEDGIHRDLSNVELNERLKIKFYEKDGVKIALKIEREGVEDD